MKRLLTRKRILCALIALILCAAALTGCDKRATPADGAETAFEANFAPETTAAGGLTAALEQTSDDPIDRIAQADDSAAASVQDISAAADAPVAEDVPVADDVPVANDEPVAQSDAQESVPAAAATAAPVTSSVSTIDGYGEVTNDELGISFSYPVNWVNQPGRSSICYLLKPTDGGYPARVCITMKKLAHSCNDSKAQAQLVSYLKKLREQYDYATFEVDLNLDTETLFMGRKAMSTTYLAYDGDVEIKGYVILTYFDKYVYCFHFLCAYDDYPKYEAAIRYMRDSAKCTLSLEED